MLLINLFILSLVSSIVVSYMIVIMCKHIDSIRNKNIGLPSITNLPQPKLKMYSSGIGIIFLFPVGLFDGFSHFYVTNILFNYLPRNMNIIVSSILSIISVLPLFFSSEIWNKTINHKYFNKSILKILWFISLFYDLYVLLYFFTLFVSYKGNILVLFFIILLVIITTGLNLILLRNISNYILIKT